MNSSSWNKGQGPGVKEFGETKWHVRLLMPAPRQFLTTIALATKNPKPMCLADNPRTKCQHDFQLYTLHLPIILGFRV